MGEYLATPLEERKFLELHRPEMATTILGALISRDGYPGDSNFLKQVAFATRAVELADALIEALAKKK